MGTQVAQHREACLNDTPPALFGLMTGVGVNTWFLTLQDLLRRRG